MNECYMIPKNGSGFIGLYVYEERGFAAAFLKSKLQKKHDYYVRIQFKPYYPRFWFTKWLYSDGLGIGLFNQIRDIDNNFTEYFYLVNDIVTQNKNGLIKDTSNWTKLSKKYRAKGNERYVIIGNYKTDEFTDLKLDGFIPSPPAFNPTNIFYVDDVVVSEFNPLPDSAILCKNGFIDFNSSFYESSYLWNTNDTISTIRVNKTGIYSVEAILDGESYFDTVNVIPEKDFRALPTDTTLCRFGTPVKLTVTVDAQYLWSTGETTHTIEASKAGIYAVTITTPQCKLYSECNVVTLGCYCQYYAPNIFTPNNDGINDKFKPEFKCKVVKPREYRFSVFNRYGQEVFRTEDQNEGWDGTWNGQKLNPDVYVWIVDFDTFIDDKYEYRKVQESGDVSLTY
jgi:gliding motility-associated-like protein